ncbi:uncharacterized protein LOC141586287 [Silene latifolia]|uniref:uncharacterized protein LOC141586287 n=1 Tax=Silene latifolia TaxID=37657 RepID=UPI003D770D01
MEVNKSKGKLTRTQSSLLRSSPTVRSSIQSLSSTVDFHHLDNDDDDVDHNNRKRAHHHHYHHYYSCGPHRKTLSVITLTLTLILTFIYLPAEENLFLAAVILTVALFYRIRLKPKTNRSNSVSVQWFIGEESTVTGANAPVTEKVKEGVEFYSNGDYYEGEFNRGKSNGNGVYNYNVKGRYEGEWVEGRYEGYGIESWAKGSRYRGMYRGGLRHGYGVYRFYTGDTYVGEWCNGQYHGLGVQSCSDGSCYVGEFKCGVKHGLGCYHFRNGDRYAGEYFGDKIHGFGVYHFANGHCYEGSWHEGRKQGYGMYTFRNGEPKCGEWDSGSLKSHLPPLTHSVLRAVQAARKAAENAINLRRVDEQVNKAVIGANRAATAARVAAVKAVQNRMDGKLYDSDA